MRHGAESGSVRSEVEQVGGSFKQVPELKEARTAFERSLSLTFGCWQRLNSNAFQVISSLLAYLYPAATTSSSGGSRRRSCSG